MLDILNSHILFVFGSARGGTTYLNTLLRDWFDFGMGPEGSFLLPVYKRLTKFGDLNEPKNLYNLAVEISKSEMLEIMRTRYPTNLRVDIAPEDILSRTEEPSYSGIVLGTFVCIAEFMGKTRIGNKNPIYWMDLPIIEYLFPGKAKYLAILRDGRDVFLSLQHVSWGKQNAYFAAKQWRSMIDKINDFSKNIEDDRFLVIQYETLLRSPDIALGQLEAFFGFSLDHKSRAGFLDQANQNPLKNNFSKWKESMSTFDKMVFEQVAGEELRRLGYDTCYDEPRISMPDIVKFHFGEWKRLARVNFLENKRKIFGK